MDKWEELKRYISQRKELLTACLKTAESNGINNEIIEAVCGSGSRTVNDILAKMEELEKKGNL